MEGARSLQRLSKVLRRGITAGLPPQRSRPHHSRNDAPPVNAILMPCEHPLWPAQPFAEDETMQRPLNIIDLTITEEVSQDAAEVARRLDKAADLVEDFAADAALNALDELVALAATPGAAVPTRAE